MIEKVYVLNLPHRQDRKWFMMGHLETIGVPEHCIEFYPARYWKDYESPDAACDAAIADDLPSFDAWRHLPRSQIVYHWNWCSILRKIIQFNDICMIQNDDRLLKDIDWKALRNAVSYLVNKHPPFRILQLNWWRHLGDDWSYVPAELVHCEVAKGTRTSGDQIVVVSPEGAKQIFDLIEQNKYVEMMFRFMSKASYPKEGLFHYIEPKMGNVNLNWGDDIVYSKEEEDRILC